MSSDDAASANGTFVWEAAESDQTKDKDKYNNQKGEGEFVMFATGRSRSNDVVEERGKKILPPIFVKRAISSNFFDLFSLFPSFLLLLRPLHKERERKEAS